MTHIMGKPLYCLTVPHLLNIELSQHEDYALAEADGNY